MTYESDQAKFYTALGLAMAASAMIRRPWCFYVVLIIGVFLSSPELIAGTGKALRTVDNGGLTKELDQAKAEVDELVKTLKKEGKWTGGVADLVDQVHTAFNEATRALKSGRNDAGKALDETAKIYHTLANVCLSAAGLMFGWGCVLMLARANIVTWVATQKVVDTAGGQTSKMLAKMAKRHGLLILTLGGLFVMLTEQAKTAGKIFPWTDGLPSEMSVANSGKLPADYSQAKLTYDAKNGGLTVGDLDALGGGGSDDDDSDDDGTKIPA